MLEAVRMHQQPEYFPQRGLSLAASSDGHRNKRHMGSYPSSRRHVPQQEQSIVLPAKMRRVEGMMDIVV